MSINSGFIDTLFRAVGSLTDRPNVRDADDSMVGIDRSADYTNIDMRQDTHIKDHKLSAAAYLFRVRYCAFSVGETAGRCLVGFWMLID